MRNPPGNKLRPTNLRPPLSESDHPVSPANQIMILHITLHMFIPVQLKAHFADGIQSLHLAAFALVQEDVLDPPSFGDCEQISAF